MIAHDHQHIQLELGDVHLSEPCMVCTSKVNVHTGFMGNTTSKDADLSWPTYGKGSHGEVCTVHSFFCPHKRFKEKMKLP